jgi:hypothetical protein
MISTHTMFSNAAIARHRAILQNLIDRIINAGLIALVGCSIAPALATRPQRLVGTVNAPVGQGWG